MSAAGQNLPNSTVQKMGLISDIFYILGRFIDKVVEVAGFISGLGMVFVSLATVYDISMRFFFDAPTTWVYDTCTYILIWFGFLAASYCLKHHGHIEVDLITGRLQPWIRNWLMVMSYILCLIYSLIISYYTYEAVIETFRTGQETSNLLHAKIWFLQLGVLIGGILLALQCIKLMVERTAIAISTPQIKIGGMLSNPYVVFPVIIFAFAFSLWLMSAGNITGMLILMLVLLFSGVPVFASLALTGVAGLFFFFGGTANWSMVPFIGYKSLNDYVLLALPVFILGGHLLQSGRMGEHLYNLCSKWVGHLPGGLAVATVAACAIFAAISGSSAATAMTIGLFALPAMIERGYNPRLAYGVVAAGGTLGILIPPSGPMIIYSSITDESTGALFMAGVFPGIIMALIFAGYTVFACARSGQYQKMPKASWAERFGAMKGAIWGILAPVIILGGIYTGVFTPLESAAVVVIYAIIVCLVTGVLKPRQMYRVMAESTKGGAMILMIIVGAMILGTVFTQLQLPQKLSNMIVGSNIPSWMVIAASMMALIVMGMCLEVVSIMLITIPLLYPIIISLGYNGIWFCVLMVITMELACITPPVGLNLYVMKAIGKTNMSEIVVGVWPFIILLVLVLVLVALVPALSLWLPSHMVGK